MRSAVCGLRTAPNFMSETGRAATSPTPKKNDIILLDITDMNNLGFGVGRHGGAVVFVRGAVAGDRIECRIIKVNKNFLVGRSERIITPSPHRAGDKYCAAPESCGGCVWRNIRYEHELELKRETVINAFRRAGLSDVKVGEVRSTGVTSGYRNKAQYPVGERAGGGLCAGFYAAGTHKIVGDADDCRLHPPVFADIARRVCDFATKKGVRAYDERTGKGILRHIYLRQGQKPSGESEITVCLVINGENFPGARELAEYLMREFPLVVGLLLNINTKNTNVVLGDRYLTVAGREYIEDTLCGLRFRIAPDAFYQVNRAGAELLYSLARERAVGEFVGSRGERGERGGTLLDLYCGAGTIGLSMAGDFSKIIGIDIVPGAIDCARENARINSITNAAFFCGDASDTDGILAAAERERGSKIDADVVILDPPRKGSTPELIKYIAARGIERVVYVSCAPDTLARDCALFRECGYEIGEVTPVDMFSRTGHVETVVLITRVKD